MFTASANIVTKTIVSQILIQYLIVYLLMSNNECNRLTIQLSENILKQRQNYTSLDDMAKLKKLTLSYHFLQVSLL